MTLKSFISFLKIAIFPVGILAITSLSEFSVSQSNVLNLVNNKKALSLFHIILLVVRFGAISFLLTSWAWFAGTTFYEEKPSLPEAFVIGWRKIPRCFLAVVPIWFITMVYAQFLFLILKAFSIIFFQVDIISGVLSVIFVTSLGLPLLLFCISKFLLLVPTVVFEKGPSVEALVKANSYVPVKTMPKNWRYLLSGSSALIIGVILPSWTFAAIFSIISPYFGSGEGLLATQLAGLALLIVAGPFAIDYIVRFYFQRIKKIKPAV